MATTLDADQEMLHFSFPIEKQEDTDTINPVDGTPDIWIVGKATDGTVDAFFFSSRRRHTRLTCDWSSDVCSSDLGRCAVPERLRHHPAPASREGG